MSSYSINSNAMKSSSILSHLFRFLRSLLSIVLSPLPLSDINRRRTLSFWQVYFFLVLPVRSISFFSVPIFSLTIIRSFLPTPCRIGGRQIKIPSLFRSRFSPSLRYLLFVWFGIETLFSIYYLITKRVVQNGATPPSYSSRSDIFRRIHKSIRDYPLFFSRWFLDTDSSILKVDDVRRWLMWAFFGKHPSDMTSSELEEVDEMMDAIKKDGKFKILPGYDDRPCIKHTLDSVSSISRPFVFYALTMSVNYFLTLFIRYYGYKFGRVGCLNYWVYDPPSRSLKKPPIIFIHGIGAGIGIYLRFLVLMVKRYPRRMILLIELNHVSMQLGASIPSCEDTLQAIDIIYRIYEIEMSVIIGHSLGTVVASWMVRNRRDKVFQTILIDPVVFLLWEVDIVYNFLYRLPIDAGDLLMYYFVSKELYISHYLHRHFWWFENVLFPDQLPKNSAVFLSAADAIVNTAVVRVYLEDHAAHENLVEVIVWPEMKHGEFQFRGIAVMQVLDRIGE